MSLKRRLIRLECRPWKRPISTINPAMDRILQRKLALPLPEGATPAERAECLRLMQTAQSRTRIDRDDTGGIDALRDYALGLHEKYKTDPLWGDPD